QKAASSLTLQQCRNVIGKRRFIDRQEVIAEFPNELYAQIFADMADKTAAHI
ncbi:hypothetical protein A8425_005546, partial [Escherichia coli]|nr:hypothetical protein [Escherichia coli]EIT9701446.1 hypothetical protein [Salmonella enterica subsp. enterica serovar Typhimurium]HBS3082781.1 hypothetical protein [Klebsiella variicola subsp. variicola]EER2399869.1 hypothetical protein [Escherichia coli]EFA0550904.1 hypothetical protein [Escherichia coli]